MERANSAMKKMNGDRDEVVKLENMIVFVTVGPNED